MAGFTVSLSGTGMDTQGVVLVNGVRAVDVEKRGAKKIEVAPDYVVDDVLSKLAALIE